MAKSMVVDWLLFVVPVVQEEVMQKTAANERTIGEFEWKAACDCDAGHSDRNAVLAHACVAVLNIVGALGVDFGIQNIRTVMPDGFF